MAVNDVSFEIRQGEILGLIGPNGSGKTTVINLLSGIHRVTRGTIMLRGQGVTRFPPHRIAALGVGRTFQLLRLFPNLTVFENILTATHLLGRHDLLAALVGPLLTRDEEDQLHQQAREVMHFVGLSHRADTPAREVTAGEGRLLELARAVAHDPDVVLLDEPASGLNTPESDALAEKLRELRGLGKSLLLVDHDMRLVMALADRLVVLNEGRVLATGTPGQIQSDSRVVEAYLGTASAFRRRARGSNTTANATSDSDG